jgi:ABC-type multidrug transport system fused ATPase/permease subunit
MFLARYFQYSLEYVAGERLTARLRREFYAVFVRKPAAFHDRHLPSDLCTALAVDADQASNFYAHMWPKLWQVFGEVAGGVGVAFYFCWQVALVVLAGLPFLIVAAALENIAVLQGANTSPDAQTTESQAVSGMIINNFELITSLGRAAEFEAKSVTMLFWQVTCCLFVFLPH